MIEYKINDRIIPNELNCFFQDWKSPPSLEIKGELLDGADLIITARENGKLIGFLTAISDGAMHAFITLVEVPEAHQGKGVGTHLMKLA
ncbi:MAG TPA: GNAT family N-acetyltransferase, partial [Thermoplasmata archaeon]|nr:GNAT family N-acetyltransferase [Thermoplasmata archaeon]